MFIFTGNAVEKSRWHSLFLEPWYLESISRDDQKDRRVSELYLVFLIVLESQKYYLISILIVIHN